MERRKRPSGNFDDVAQAACEKLLSSSVLKTIPQEEARAVVGLAFAYGAAWALDEPKLIELGNDKLSRMTNMDLT